MSGAGDVDGDGFDDILVGTGEGAAYLVFSFNKDSIQLAANGKRVTYTDLDGDRVTIATSKGTLGLSQLVFAAEDSSSYGSQLNSLSFAAQQFTGANITITAKPGPRGGDGRVNIGTLDATGVNLGKVNIDGDIGHDRDVCGHGRASRGVVGRHRIGRVRLRVGHGNVRRVPHQREDLRGWRCHGRWPYW